MIFYNIRQPSYRVSLKEAIVQGIAPDQGLFMPDQLKPLPRDFLASLPQLSFFEIAFGVAQHLLADDLSNHELEEIVKHTIAFDAPLVRVHDRIFSLELFHGPTLAFKDFGARFLAGLMSLYAGQYDREVTILVATSGDTGSAVANGFLGVKGTRVVVLYPKGKVSDIQEKQFTTLGQNIHAVEVKGTFDDCQRLVKEAFVDALCREKLFMTSANSINVGRLIPQMFYYFRAVAQLSSADENVCIAVPSGNFGNLTAGLMAKKLGLPVKKFVAATNVNDVVPKFINTGLFKPRPSLSTISNAMDVGNPSNFERLVELYNNNFAAIRADIKGCAFTDDETKRALSDVFSNQGYLLDPHGAIGYLALKNHLTNDDLGIFLETAHPGKFQQEVERVIGHEITLPPRLQAFLAGEKRSVEIEPTLSALREVILAEC